MYFPYLRGRQYELLALKELVQKNLLGNSIIPVVEPVKFSPTLKATVEEYGKVRHPLAVVFNPKVVALSDDDLKRLLSFIPNSSVVPSVISDSTLDTAVSLLKTSGINKDQICVVLTEIDGIKHFKEEYALESPLFTLIPDKRDFRRLENVGHKVLFEDKFIKQLKNSDYLKNEDEVFSDDHLFYKEEGYFGFGDYSTIGDAYEESGFAPRAVAVHLVYFDSSDALRVHHFVSDTNYGIEDVAGKYFEAIVKLQQFAPILEEKNKTNALVTLLSHAKAGYYPGLPTLKKLSIMHHIELMGRFLDGRV